MAVDTQHRFESRFAGDTGTRTDKPLSVPSLISRAVVSLSVDAFVLAAGSVVLCGSPL